MSLQILIPNNFPNFIASIALLVAIVCLSFSFCEKRKTHATKLFGVMLVVSISLFSSHWATYFAAIFIVATVVTELEFLQNLAAIIRKDENYFNYKKETLSKSEKIRRKVEETLEEELVSEIQQDGLGNKSSTTIDLLNLKELPRSSILRLTLDIENSALNYLEKEFGKIERGVRFSKNGNTVEFDGVISKKNGCQSIVFDIKWARNSEFVFGMVNMILRSAQDQIDKYEKITGQKPIFHLIIIVNDKTGLNLERKARLMEKAQETSVSLKFLSLTEIGFEVIHKIS